MNSVPLSPITADEKDSLVALLLACDDSKDFWDKTISELPDDIKLYFKEDPVPQRRVNNLVVRSLDVNHGLESLLNRVRANTSRNNQWYELARVAFRMMTRFPEESKHLANHIVDQFEEIVPSPQLLGVIYRKFPSILAFALFNGYQAILRLFQLPDKTSALQFVQMLADTVESPDQQALIRQWVVDAA